MYTPLHVYSVHMYLASVFTGSHAPAAFAVAKFVPAKFLLPTMCFCQQLQTQTYEIVKGSYVPAGDTKQATKVEVLRIFGIGVREIWCLNI